VKRTRLGTLLGIGLAAIPAGWILGLLADAIGGGLPAVPWILVPLLVFMAVLIGGGARVVRGWVTERRYSERVDALLVARLLALAKAVAVFGAVVAGGYVGLGLLAFDRLSGTIARDRALLSGAVALGGLLVAVAAVRLERACEVPRPPEDDDAPE
jgi:hypothetical protein